MVRRLLQGRVGAGWGEGGVWGGWHKAEVGQHLFRKLDSPLHSLLTSCFSCKIQMLI